MHPDCGRAARDAARLCEALGHRVEEAAPEVDGNELSQQFITLWSAGAAWSIDDWARRTGQTPTPDAFEPLTWGLYEMGNRRTAAAYLLALQDLQRASRAVARFFARHDVWLTPTLGEPPLPLGSFDPAPDNPLQGLFRAAAFVPFTPICNITGQPAMSLPLHWNAEGLPIGVHVVGRFGDEATLFRLAAQLEQARPWARRWPGVGALQYFSAPNQFIVTGNSSHNPFMCGLNWMSYRPDHEVQCCPGNVHRAMPNFINRMWMRAEDGGVMAALYGPRELRTTVGKAKTPVTITSSTPYPYQQEIRFTIQPESPVKFAFHVRVPGWCRKAKLKVNGKKVEAKLRSGTFFQLKRLWKPGDEVQLELPFELALEQWPDDGVSLRYGPLTLAMPIQARAEVETENSTSTPGSGAPAPPNRW